VAGEENCSSLLCPVLLACRLAAREGETEVLKNADLLTEKYLDDETPVNVMGKGLVHAPGRGKKQR
jgi:hypothetical protein